jgi:hypothetical protein
MKKVIRLTESDLARIVRRVIKEGARVVLEPDPWNKIKGVMKGDTMKSTEDGTLILMRGGKTINQYNGFSIIQNPRQVQLNQSGAMNVISFDPNKQTVTFNNGLVIGPA